MVEGNLFKTKLCILYQKGRCTRHSCNFAHGNAELRGGVGGHPPPFEGERDRRGSDLRGRLDNWHSPPRRGWEGREQRPYMGHVHDPSSSLERSQMKRKFNHREEFSGNVRFSLQSDDRVRDGSFRAPNSKSNMVDELKQVQSDVDKLNARKAQLQHFLEERDKEINALSFRLKELEAQLYEEREESHRVSSKIKKFVKAYNRHSRIQDELNRSQARLHKLGVQLSSHIASSSAQGEDWTVNALSEDEGGNQILNSGSLLNEERHNNEAARSVRASQQSSESSLAHRENGAVIIKNGNTANASSGIDRKKETVMSSTIRSSEPRSSNAGHVLPATGMAAHADDEGANLTVMEKAPVIESAWEGNLSKLLPPPPPPPPPPSMKDTNSKNEVFEDTFDEESVHVDIV